MVLQALGTQPNIWNTPNYIPNLLSGAYATPSPQPNYAVSGPALDIFNRSRQASQANYNVMQLNNPANPYRAGANQAAWNTLAARRATLPLQAGVLGARGQQNAAQRNYINLQSQITGQRGVDVSRLNAAENNVADKQAVALAQQAQQGEDARYRMLNTAAPVSIDTPYTDNTALPGGVRRSLRPQSAYVGEEIQQAERVRGNQLASAQNQVSQAGANVSDANLALDYGQLNAQSAGLDEQGANLQLQQQQQGAQYLASLARYNYEESQVPPEPGLSLYKSPVTGKSLWATPIDASKHEAIDKAVLGEPNNLIQLIANGFITSQEAADALTALGANPQVIATITQQAQRIVTQRQQPTAQEKQQQQEARPLGRYDESDMVTELASVLAIRAPWNTDRSTEQMILAELTARYGAAAAQIKFAQIEAAAKKRVADAGIGVTQKPALQGPGFGP